MKTISFETLIKWKWQYYDGHINCTVTRPSDGKVFLRHYCNCISYMILWHKTRKNWGKTSDGWIYFTVNGKKYRTSLNPNRLENKGHHKI